MSKISALTRRIATEDGGECGCDFHDAIVMDVKQLESCQHIAHISQLQ